MRWIAILLLWVAAVVVAVVILRRVRRGKPVVLTGRWSPRLVRMIAVVLVVLGAGDEAVTPDTQAAPVRLPLPGAELPGTVTPQAVQVWLVENQPIGRFAVGRRHLLQGVAGRKLEANERALANSYAARLPGKARAMLSADLQGVQDGKAVPATPDADLLAALDELETSGRFDHALNAYLWRKAEGPSKDPADRIRLFARIGRHARVTDALLRAYAQVKPVMLSPRAWMSKAGPRPEDLRAEAAALADILKVAAQVYRTTDEGTWKRDGVVQLKPVAGSPAPVLVRAGNERAWPLGEAVQFGRLDLLKTGDKPAVVEHDGLGKIELPANRLLSARDLPGLLPQAAQQKLDELVHDALTKNSEEAADRLEQCLAVSHQAIRVGLKELPNAKGAPRLRLILSLFDDVVMPTLPVHRPEAAGRAGLSPPDGEHVLRLAHPDDRRGRPVDRQLDRLLPLGFTRLDVRQHELAGVHLPLAGDLVGRCFFPEQLVQEVRRDRCFALLDREPVLAERPLEVGGVAALLGGGEVVVELQRRHVVGRHRGVVPLAVRLTRQH